MLGVKMSKVGPWLLLIREAVISGKNRPLECVLVGSGTSPHTGGEATEFITTFRTPSLNQFVDVADLTDQAVSSLISLFRSTDPAIRTGQQSGHQDGLTQRFTVLQDVDIDVSLLSH